MDRSLELIFGGENTRLGEFPFTALIRQNISRQTSVTQVIKTQLKAPKGSLKGAYFAYQYLELCLFTVRKLASATSRIFELEW